MPKSIQRQLLTTAEAAARLSIGKSTLRKYIAEGKIPAIRVGDKLIRFDPDDIENFKHRIEN